MLRHGCSSEKSFDQYGSFICFWEHTTGFWWWRSVLHVFITLIFQYISIHFFQCEAKYKIVHINFQSELSRGSLFQIGFWNLLWWNGCQNFFRSLSSYCIILYLANKQRIIWAVYVAETLLNHSHLPPTSFLARV